MSSVQNLPRGGMWERQALYGGERLKDRFTLGEQFILWGIKSAGEVTIERKGAEAEQIPKTVLDVSTTEAPDEHFEVGTLSSAIADMVPLATAEDFPVLAFWKEVDTEQGLNPATVLEGVRRYEPES